MIRPETPREWALWNEIENLRASALRVLGSEIDLLNTAVIAYGNGKTYVTIDHVERAVERLTMLRNEFKDK